MMVAGSVPGGLISWRAAALTPAIRAANGVVRIFATAADGAPPGAVVVRGQRARLGVRE